MKIMIILVYGDTIELVGDSGTVISKLSDAFSESEIPTDMTSLDWTESRCFLNGSLVDVLPDNVEEFVALCKNRYPSIKEQIEFDAEQKKKEEDRQEQLANALSEQERLASRTEVEIIKDAYFSYVRVIENIINEKSMDVGFLDTTHMCTFLTSNVQSYRTNAEELYSLRDRMYEVLDRYYSGIIENGVDVISSERFESYLKEQVGL